MREDLKIGMKVTAYKAGYHEIVDIQRRWKRKDGKYQSPPMEYDPEVHGEEYSPLITYRQLFNAKGKPINSTKTHQCDAGFCIPAEIDIKNRITEMESLIETLKKLEI